jgi:hypothetical protein
MLAYLARRSGAKRARTGIGGGSVGRENLKISPNPDFWARGTQHDAVNPQTRPCDHRNTRLVVAVAVLMHARAPSQAIRCQTGANGDRWRVSRSRKFENIANPRFLGPRHPARLGKPTNTPVRSPQHTASCCSCRLMHARAPGPGDPVPNGRKRGSGGASVGRENLKISPNPDFWAHGTPHGSVNPQTRPCDHCNTRLVVAVAV